jgi:hypothetical protein
MTDFKYERGDLETMSFAPKYHAWIFSEFRGFIGKRVAEVGAGCGSFSSLFLNEPVNELVVIEPAKDMCVLLQTNIMNDTRVVIRNAFFQEVNAEYSNYFDSVVYINVLEHVEDEIKELACIYESLKMGGYVCIFVPALSWLYSDHDKSIGHYRRYYKKQLSALLEKSGFKIEKVKYFDIIGIIPWFIMFKLFKKKIDRGNVGLYDKYIVQISRIIESLIPPPIGKNLIIVGRKIG